MWETTEVYVYTRLPSSGELLEHHGHLRKGERCASFSNIHNSHHWMTSLSNNEGEVRGHSVWFLKPNREAAVKALDAKDKERAERLLERSARMLERMSI